MRVCVTLFEPNPKFLKPKSKIGWSLRWTSIWTGIERYNLTHFVADSDPFLSSNDFHPIDTTFYAHVVDQIILTNFSACKGIEDEWRTVQKIKNIKPED